MKVYYWSPFISYVATTASVINSIKSINKFSKKKIDCKIINVFKEWDPFIKLLRNNNIETINLKNFLNINFLPKGGFFKSRFTYFIVFFLSIINLHILLKEKKPNYLIIHLISSVPLTLLNLFSYDTKFILRISGYPKINFWRKFLWKKCNNKIDKVFCPTISTKNLLIKNNIFSPSKLFLVSDPVIDIGNINEKKRKNLSQNFDWLKKREFVLSIGRLTKQKNFEFLIDSFNEIIKDYPNLNLVILGDGENKDYLESRIVKNNLQNNIFLLGYQENIYPFLENSLFFVLTSEWEDPGFVILESMFARKIVLSSDCESGPREIIKDNINGFLYKKKDVLNFKEKFFKVLNLIKKKDESIEKILYQGIITSRNYSKFSHFQKITKHIE